MEEDTQGDRSKGINPTTFGDEHVIPVLQEKLHIDTVARVTGTVQVSTTVSSREVDIPLTDTFTTYRETRIPRNSQVDIMPRVRYEGDTLVIPVVREEAYVATRLILVEEIHLVKETTHEDHAERVVLRSETARVDRTTGKD